jgi:hypothetical protein
VRISLQPLVIASLSLVVIAGGGAAAVELQTAATAETAPAVQETPAQEEPVAAEPVSCLSQPEAPSIAEQQAGHTGVRFVVPPSTTVAVDHLGRPVEVSTNTGQAPCATDLFVQVAPDGTRTLADDALRRAVLDQQPAGPWSPGVARALAAG